MAGGTAASLGGGLQKLGSNHRWRLEDFDTQCIHF
jgi:hypothetical protein